MLLYDRIFEQIALISRRWGEAYLDARMNQTERVIRTGLKDAVVYDLCNVTPLFQDWELESSKSVPRRPPFNSLWAEWNYEDDLAFFRLGCLIQFLGSSSEWADAFLDKSPTNGVWMEIAKQGGTIWDVRFFRYLESVKEKELSLPFLKKVTADPGVFYFTLHEDDCKVTPYCLRFPRSPETDCVFDFPQWGPDESDLSYDPLCIPWQPFMAFALLHCRNVVTEDHVPDARTQRRVQKAGNPPRVTYKTLRIEVPASVQKRGEYEGDEEDSGPKVRFHLCSGHFKHLTSERYKAKRGQWVWCPAHWKGNKVLGEVHKRYNLVPDN